MKKLIILILPVLIIVFGLGVYFYLHQNKTDSGKVKITASFYPLAFLATQIGGDKVEVINLTPVGSEPHDFEPSASDVSGIYQSKLFIYNGANLESWGDDIANQLSAKNVLVLKASDYVELLKSNNLESAEIGDFDPHFWLDPKRMQQISKQILADLIKVDPKHQSTYEKNAANLSIKLDGLDLSYKNGLANCKLNKFVTAHAAFSYLASKYNFEQVSILGISPDSEPSANQMTLIANIVKENNIKYIFFETLTSPKLSETIASATGAQTLVLNPVEGLTVDQERLGQDYVTIMLENLANLQVALGCK